MGLYNCTYVLSLSSMFPSVTEMIFMFQIDEERLDEFNDHFEIHLLINNKYTEKTSVCSQAG